MPRMSLLIMAVVAETIDKLLVVTHRKGDLSMPKCLFTYASITQGMTQGFL